MSANRAVTLDGANKIFSVGGIEIQQSPLKYYESKGAVELQAPTLTALCQAIVLQLIASAQSK